MRTYSCPTRTPAVNTATAATVKTIRRENNNDEGCNGDGNHDGRDNLFRLWCWRQLAVRFGGGFGAVKKEILNPFLCSFLLLDSSGTFRRLILLYGDIFFMSICKVQ
ncbi:hypothetical protein P8452_33947 [Trifolium repens]|nr:hypothetical protein P8452_33947 [Trifolium repens]